MTLFAAVTVAAGLAALPASANGGKKSAPAPMPVVTQTCTGGFSNGNKISITAPVNMLDVGYAAGDKTYIAGQNQTACDVYTYAWNQFLNVTQMSADPNNKGMVTPAFLHWAPWYNTLKADPPPGQKPVPPGPFPGGATDLRTAFLDQGQAGTDGHLLDVNGQTVRYDIRFNSNMYGQIALQPIYNEQLFTALCNRTNSNPNKNGGCINSNNMWFAPLAFNELPYQGAVEIKTAWRDFGNPTQCPATFYCNGRFGLVGLHYVSKTNTHGEWVWASFEHVANDPDCAKGGDNPILPMSPLKTEWSFFNPKTVPSGVLQSQTCNVANSPPQCNTNPGGPTKWVPTNVCRTVSIMAGGANAANCAVPAPSAPGNMGNVACLNATIMPQRSGVWQNYKMIGAMWIKGGMAGAVDFRINGFQPQVTGLPFVDPAGFKHLASTTIETWLQAGSTGYDPFKTNGTQAGCFLCHNMPSSFAGHNKQMDMSHFPGKLPTTKLAALKSSLLPANSLAAAPK
jgi:hypothetical protein